MNIRVEYLKEEKCQRFLTESIAACANVLAFPIECRGRSRTAIYPLVGCLAPGLLFVLDAFYAPADSRRERACTEVDSR
jgi:hypothetical protein